MEKTRKKTTKMVQQKNKPIKWLHWKINLQSSQKIWYHSLWRKLLYYQDLNRRRAKHDISSIAIKKYDTIVFEENYSTIKILIGGEQNMIFPLSRFIKRLKDKFQLYKPEADGVQFVKPHNTSRTCHHCGHINKELKVKTRNTKS